VFAQLSSKIQSLVEQNESLKKQNETLTSRLTEQEKEIKTLTSREALRPGTQEMRAQAAIIAIIQGPRPQLQQPEHLQQPEKV